MAILTTFNEAAEAFRLSLAADAGSDETVRLALIMNAYLKAVTEAPEGLTTAQIIAYAENHIIAMQQEQQA